MGQFRNHPALIVWGGPGFCFNDQFLHRWQGMLADLQCVRISDAGHYVLEDAAPQAIPLIKAHLLKA